MKTCFKCRVTLPLTEFYPHPQMGDGYLGKCKGCTKADTAARVARKMKDPIWINKEAERCRIKARKCRELGNQSPRSKESAKKWEKINPHKRLAHHLVQKAIQSCRLVKMPCQKCGHLQAEAHHEDYSKPLDVVWLCPKHHGERHVEINDQKRIQKALSNQ
jgi:hypothetical protein